MPNEPIRMNRNDLLALHKQMCDNAHGIMQRKNADYSGQKGADPFANFRRCEAMGICSTEAGTLTRMCDKMSRLSSFIERGELSVKEESVRDTCEDLINYSILLYGILAEKHGWLLPAGLIEEGASNTRCCKSVGVFSQLSTKPPIQG